MLSALTGQSLQEISQAVDGLWARAGHENLSGGFDAFAIGGERNQRLDKAGYRAGVTTGNTIIHDTLSGSSESKAEKSSRFSTALNQAITNAEFLDKLINDIDLEIAEIDERIGVIDSRVTEIQARRSVILDERDIAIEDLAELEDQREEVVEEITELEGHLETATLAEERAIRDVMRATGTEQIERSQDALTTAREEAELATRAHLDGVATLDDLNAGISQLTGAIDLLDTELADLSTEEIALLEERGDLVSSREQLVVMRDQLSDPELRAAVERGDMSREDVLQTMPEELQAGILESLTQRFQSGWDGVSSAVSNKVSAGLEGIKSFFTSAHDGESPATIPVTPEGPKQTIPARELDQMTV